MPGSILENPDSRIPPPLHPASITPRLEPRRAVLLKDGQTRVTLYPIGNGPDSVPGDLVKFLHAEFSAEIERGCTYPMEEPMPLDKFADYWFGTFAVVAVISSKEDEDGLKEGRDWERECLGTFYVKPNYPGSSFFPSSPFFFFFFFFFFLDASACKDGTD